MKDALNIFPILILGFIAMGVYAVVAPPKADRPPDRYQLVRQEQRDVTAYAWGLIMQKVLTLRADGVSINTIEEMLTIPEGHIPRWISEDITGEFYSFGELLFYAKRLNIPFKELIKPEDS